MYEMGVEVFNALKYIKNLEAVGVPREQAEAQVQLVIAAIEDEVASKSELSQTRSELKTEIAEFRAEVRAEFAGVRAEFSKIRSEMSDLKSELTFKLGALFIGSNTVGFGFFGILLAYLSHKP